MSGRWLAALALIVSGLVVGHAPPAVACSCVTDQPAELVDNAAVAFVGVLTSQRTDDDDVVHRFTVSMVYRGEVHRTQDVVTPAGGDAACGVEWETGARMVVLAYVDEGSRVAANVCTGSTTIGESADTLLVAALGAGSDPLAGDDLVEISRVRSDHLVWISLGVVGVCALGWVALRRRHVRPST